MINLISKASGIALASTLVVSALHAQGQATARGTILDDKGVPVIGATVRLKSNPSIGTTTDLDGRFALNVPKGSVLLISYIGYTSREVTVSGEPLNIILSEDNKSLREVVVVGYGSMQKKDLTGSITTINDKNFQRGAIATPSELLVGKVAGVQITPNGSPGAGSTIRIRGGASLNASNDPLIVIDGVPVDNSTSSGSPSILSSINPQDIASMVVLKDASATAIYGSRASNGVIIIETKRGKSGQDMQISFSTNNSLSEVSRQVKVMTGDEFREFVKQYGNSDHQALLGDANTNWQDQIYQLAYGTDNNVSISGAAGTMPYRTSLGLYHQEGVLKTEAMQRFSSSFTLSPRLLDNHLNIDLNLKLSLTRNRFADHEAISSAIMFDPTQPVYMNDTRFGGYFNWVNSKTNNLIQLAPKNPLGILEQRDNSGSSFRSLGNIKFDYKLHFLPELKFNLNLGFDYSAGRGFIKVPENAASGWYNSPIAGQGGEDNQYKQRKRNLLLDFYANYNKEIKAISSRVDIMAGYSYQDWKTFEYSFPNVSARGQVISRPLYDRDYPQNTLISYYARLNWNFLERYMLTATVRTDGSSRFSPETRWGIFPSLAFAWRINEERFLKNVKVINDLKLRLGYGITGQQDGIANYSYLQGYYLGDNTHMYQFGNTFYNMYRPAAYDRNIKWEQTETYNAGLDFGLLGNRLSGTIDVYYKKTKDLLNVIPIPAGANFSNTLLTNIGNIENKGLEFTLNATPIQSDKFSWDISYNLTVNRTKITKLNAVEDPNYLGAATGGIKGGTGSTIQIHSVGHAPSAFYVYKQLYDTSGKPIEGAYADLNGDGIINNKDRYHYKSPNPDMLMGFSTSLSYGRWALSTALRASIGNYIYDNISSSMAFRNGAFSSGDGFLLNTPKTIAETGFTTAQYFSDYYVTNASFLKMDNVSLSYDFGKICRNVGLRASATVQNVFTISNYHGIDPERGIDYQLYPLPRTYSLNLSFSL